MNITIKRVTDDGETDGDSTYNIYHNLGGMMVVQGHSRKEGRLSPRRKRRGCRAVMSLSNTSSILSYDTGGEVEEICQQHDVSSPVPL